MTDTATDPPAAEAAVTKIPYPTMTAGWLNLFAPLVLVSLALSLIALVVAINADETTIIQGGGDGDGGAASTTLDAELGEFFFTFTPPTIAGDTDVAVTMTNTGSIEHNMVVLDAGKDPSSGASITDDMIVTQFDDLQSGESLSGTLNLAPETYLVVCLIPGHLESGMKASLTVAGA